MDHFWQKHLSDSLLHTGVIAYVWDVAEDSFRWAGDLHGLTGLKDDDRPVTKKSFHDLINPQELPSRVAALHAALSGTPARITYKLKHIDGSQKTVEEEASRYTEEKSGKIFVFGTLRSAAVQDEALADPMQDGRKKLHRVMERWAEQPEDIRQGRGYLLTAGIDHLTLMNETFGAAHVDELIRETGVRIRHLVGNSAFVSRINGDVFGIFLSDGPHGEMAAVANHLLSRFSDAPLLVGDEHVNLGVSLGGVCVSLKSCKDIPSLVTKAEMALQGAKEHGRGCFISYEETENQAAKNKAMLQTGNSFLQALKDGRVRLAFQPVTNFDSRDVSFHECLIRMIDENGRLCSAGEFVPAVEHMGLSRLVDRYTLNKAIHELGQFPDLVLSVNVSYMTLVSKDWLRSLVATLRDRPSLACRLIIEITEGMIVQDMKKAMSVIRTLKDLGCRVALDDFGAGFTAFSQLRDFEPDIVKIDKSFVQDMKDGRSQMFIRALKALADGVNVETVCEGVESMEDARILAAEGINNIQGYAFGYPCVERIWLPKGHAFRHVSQIEQPTDVFNTTSADSEEEMQLWNVN